MADADAYRVVAILVAELLGWTTLVPGIASWWSFRIALAALAVAVVAGVFV